MTDRELLELAAKAAGYWVCEPLRYGEFRVCLPEQHHLSFAWNPLTDDGEALRLAVALRIHVRHFSHDVEAQIERGYWQEDDGTDPFAATRRAIVRAAVAIAKAEEKA